jgi:hypothetical protein
VYGCETWSLILREENRLKVFESRLQRRIYGPKREEVTGGWRKLHNEELRDLYSSLSTSIIRIMKSRRMRWAGHVELLGEVYTLLAGIPKGKRPLGRPRRRWVDNIKMDLIDIVWCGVDCIGVTQDRYNCRALVNAVMNLWVP